MRTIRRLTAIATGLVLATVGMAAVAPASDGVPHILVFSGTFGYRHGGIVKMKAMIDHLAELTGAFTVEHTEDAAAFTPELYDRIDGILFLQTTGEPTFDSDQRSRFLRFASCGGAFIGVHAASDSSGWDEYTDLIGARFAAHGHLGSPDSYVEKAMEDADHPGEVPFEVDLPAVTDVTVNVEDQTHPATAPWHGRPTFRFSDELYQYQESPRKPGVNVLLSLDNESDYWLLQGTAPNPRIGLSQISPWFGYRDDTPLAWTKSYGDGRVFYTNLGHNPKTWDRPDFQQHLVGGIGWATQVRPDASCIDA